MPLHEYLEQKRRDNIEQLNASGACHICGSNSRNSKGFNHFVDNEEKITKYTNEHSMVKAPDLAAMRTCACFGQSPDDPDYWPYSLRVCDRCIQDDKGIGRIRNCGICGVVACDENCGAELLECTDCTDERMQAGCIDCRKFSDFSEMAIFRKIPPQNHGEPRMTRVCHKCLEQSTPWVRYDFVCRRFRCENRLVPSDIAERKRFTTFGSSPLNLLPEDGLVNIVSYLSGTDLKKLFFTCSAMCLVAERVAKEKIERIQDDLLTGPIFIGERKDGFGQKKPWTHFEGKNDFPLRAPDDEKAWVGVYHYLEKVIEETYYFGFQMKGDDGDKEIVNKFINLRSDEKFSFGQTYHKVEDNLVPTPTVGLSMRGGTILVTGGGQTDVTVSPSPVVIASRLQLPRTGITRLLCRVFAPGVGGARGNNRDAQSYKLGSIGILRLNQTGEGAANQWAQRQDVMEPWVKEETTFGFQFDADEGTMIIHGCSNLSRSSRYNSNRYTIRTDTPGDLYIGFELCPKQLGINKALLSVRNIDEDEWTKFLAHAAEHNAPIRGNNNNAADMFDPVHALEVLNNAQGEGGPQPLRIRHQIFRQAVRNRRRERAAAEAANNNNGNNNNNNGAAAAANAAAAGNNNVHRVQVRVLEGGRRVAQMLPRNPQPQQQQQAQGQQQPRPRVGLVQLVNDRIIARGNRQQADIQAQINHAQQLLNNPPRAAPFNVGVANRGAPRRIVRAIRPPQAQVVHQPQLPANAQPPQGVARRMMGGGPPQNNAAQPQGVARRMMDIDMRGVVPRPLVAGARQNDAMDEDSSFDSQETIPFRRHYDPDNNM